MIFSARFADNNTEKNIRGQKMTKNNSFYDDLPSGLAMMLARDTRAMSAYEKLGEDDKNAFVRMARNVSSRADMRRLVKAMSEADDPLKG